VRASIQNRSTLDNLDDFKIIVNTLAYIDII